MASYRSRNSPRGGTKPKIRRGGHDGGDRDRWELTPCGCVRNGMWYSGTRGETMRREGDLGPACRSLEGLHGQQHICVSKITPLAASSIIRHSETDTSVRPKKERKMEGFFGIIIQKKKSVRSPFWFQSTTSGAVEGWPRSRMGNAKRRWERSGARGRAENQNNKSQKRFADVIPNEEILNLSEYLRTQEASVEPLRGL